MDLTNLWKVAAAAAVIVLAVLFAAARRSSRIRNRRVGRFTNFIDSSRKS